MLNEVVSKGDFARRCGVTRGRVSQWLREGKIGPEALDGTGCRAPIKADVALGMLRDRLDWFRGGSVADLGGSRGDIAAQKFQGAAARTLNRGPPRRVDADQARTGVRRANSEDRTRLRRRRPLGGL